MTQQRVWFFPDISFQDYLKKYPFVFFFSALSGFAWLFEGLLRVYLSHPIAHGSVFGFDLFSESLLFSIPLFALIHLLLESTWLGKLKYNFLAYPLGFVLWYCFFIFLLEDPAQDTSDTYTHFMVTACSAVVIIPLIGMGGSSQRKWVYLINSVVRSAGGLLVFAFFAMITSYIAAQISSDLFSGKYMSSLDSGLINALSTLFFPWYLMGMLSGALDPGKTGKEGGRGFAILFYASILAVLVFYCFEGSNIAQWLMDPKKNTNIADDILACLLLALLSFLLMVPLVLKNPRAWLGRYRRIVSGISLVFLMFALLGHFKNQPGDPWNSDDYVTFFFMLWLAGVFTYFLLKEKAEWSKPLFALLALMVITLAGPLDPRELTFQGHKGYLEKLLGDAGMFREKHVVKPEVELSMIAYGKITAEFSSIARHDGLVRLQKWFSLDLGDLGAGDGAEEQAQRLMKRIGISQCGNLDFDSLARSYNTKRPAVLDIAGYREQADIEFTGGCSSGVLPEKQFEAGLSGENELLTVKYGSAFLADIPLAPLAKSLLKYDYNDRTRERVPFKTMTLEYENKKIKLRIYFSKLSALRNGKELKISSGEGLLLVNRK